MAKLMAGGHLSGLFALRERRGGMNSFLWRLCRMATRWRGILWNVMRVWQKVAARRRWRRAAADLNSASRDRQMHDSNCGISALYSLKILAPATFSATLLTVTLLYYRLHTFCWWRLCGLSGASPWLYARHYLSAGMTLSVHS